MWEGGGDSPQGAEDAEEDGDGRCPQIAQMARIEKRECGEGCDVGGETRPFAGSGGGVGGGGGSVGSEWGRWDGT